MNLETQALIADVQFNCHITDARHGTDFGLCTYLMKMREYYRWEMGLPQGQPLDKDQVGDWLTEREDLWDAVSEDEFRALRLAGQDFDPFEAAQMNRHLASQGLLYSAGLIYGGKPQFFVTELLEHQVDESGFELWIGGRELARGLQAPPAMTQGKHIFLRRDALRQLLWERYESWLWSKPDNAFKRAIACYPFADDIGLALDQMTAAEMAVIHAHEVGEFRVGQQLGEDWEQMLLATIGTPAELMLRGVRDYWADCAQTLPMLLADPQRDASVHTFIGSLGNMRKSLFPALLNAYELWCKGERDALREQVEQGELHWQEVAEDCLLMWRAGQPELGKALGAYIDSKKL